MNDESARSREFCHPMKIILKLSNTSDTVGVMMFQLVINCVNNILLYFVFQFSRRLGTEIIDHLFRIYLIERILISLLAITEKPENF